MPKSSKASLAWHAKKQKEPAEVAKRVARNAARQAAIKAGTAHVGDGTEVDHIIPLDAGGSTRKSNTRVISKAKNRAWRKDRGDMYGK